MERNPYQLSVSVLVRFSHFCATSAEQKICRLTSQKVALFLEGIALFSAHKHESLSLSLLDSGLHLGTTVNPGSDGLSAVLIHACGWNGTRLLMLPWPPLILSLLNILVNFSMEKGYPGFCVLPRNEFGKEFPYSFHEFPSSVPCCAHCITWSGRRVCSCRTPICTAGWKPLLFASSLAPQHLLSVWLSASTRKLSASVSCKRAP